MNGVPLHQRAPELAEALARGGFQKNLARRCAIAATTLAILITVAALLGLADYHWVFPRWVRLVGGGLMLAALAAGTKWLWREWNRYSNARRVALHLERRHPELGCVLSTAVEYAETDRSPQANNPYEEVLVNRLIRTAARESSEVRPDLWSEARRAFPVVLSAGIIGGLLLAFVPDVPVVLKRVMTPWETVGYTLLDVTPGTTDWPAGEPVEIRASFRGPLTTPPKITWTHGQEPRRTAWMERMGPSDFGFRFPEARQTIDYTVNVARLEPVSHRITPVEMPKLQEIEVRITPPDYTGAPVVTSHQLSLSLLSGSRVSLSFHTDRALSKISLWFENGEELPMVQSKENTWLAHWFPAETTTYRLAFTDENGRTLRDPRNYPLVIIPDHPPRLRWESPFPDRGVRTGVPIPFSLRITDDHGGVAARFFWKKVGEPGRASTLTLEEIRPGEWLAHPILQIPENGTLPGDLILVWAEASDTRHRTAETVARSRPLAFISQPSDPSSPENSESAENPDHPAPSIPAKKPGMVSSPWFDLAWILHAGVFSLSATTPPEAIADLRAEVTFMSELVGLWLNGWERVAPATQHRTEAVRSALPDLGSALNSTGRDAGGTASEKVLAAIAALLYHADQSTAEEVTRLTQPRILERVAVREREWLDAAAHWSKDLKAAAQTLSLLNQRVAGAERIGNLPVRLRDVHRQVEGIEGTMQTLAEVNPLCSHQLLRPVREANRLIEQAATAADQGEPGQAVRASTRAVKRLMDAAERLDEEIDPAHRLSVDGVRDLPGDPMEGVLRLYFRRIAEVDS